MGTIFFTLVLSITAGAATLNEVLAEFGKNHSTAGKVVLEKNASIKKGKFPRSNISFISENTKNQLEVSAPVNETVFSSTRKNYFALTLKKYQDEPMPYQGEITNTSTCPKQFMPIILYEKVGAENIYIIKIFTGTAYAHRICEDKLIAFSTCTSFYFDAKKKQSFKLTASVPGNQDCVKPTVDFFSNLKNL